MATTEQYINSLKSNRNNLVDNLIQKGVVADYSETFNSLIAKVLQINGSNNNINGLNITYSLTEPTDDTKDIWIKTENVNKTIITDNIQSQENVVFSSFSFPPTLYMTQSNVIYGSNIYCPPGESESNNIIQLDTEDLQQIILDFQSETFMPGIALINNDIYLIGGLNADDGEFKNTVIKYNIDSKTSTHLIINNFNGLVYISAAVIGNKIYISGLDNTLTSKFGFIDIDTLTYTDIDLMQNIPMQLSTLCALNNKIYIIGGINESEDAANNKILEFNPDTGLVTELIDISSYFSVPCSISAHSYNNKIILLLGGNDNISINKNVYEFDLSNNTITTIGEFAYAIPYSQSALVDNSIYVFGGDNQSDIYKIDLSPFNVYNFTKTTDSISSTIYNQINDNIYILDGNKENNVKITKPIKYNFADNSMIELAVNLPNNYYPRTSCVVNNKIYTIDGQDSTEGYYSENRTLILREFNTDTLTFSTVDIQLPGETCDVVRCCYLGDNKILYIVYYKESSYPNNYYNLKLITIDLTTKTIINTERLKNIEYSSATNICNKLFVFNKNLIIMFDDYVIKYNLISKQSKVIKADFTNGCVSNSATELIGTCIYSFGGFTGSVDSYDNIIVYNLLNDKYYKINSLPKRLGYLISAVNNNQLYLIGGKGYSISNYNKSVLEYKCSSVFTDINNIIITSNVNNKKLKLVVTPNYEVNFNISQGYKQLDNIIEPVDTYIKENNEWKLIGE